MGNEKIRNEMFYQADKNCMDYHQDRNSCNGDRLSENGLRNSWVDE